MEKENNQTIMAKMHNLNTFDLGNWIRLESPINNPYAYKENLEKLRFLTQNTPWDNSELTNLYLANADFCIFIGNDNLAHIAIIMDNEAIFQVRGIKNEAQEIEDEYREVVLDFLKKNKLQYSEEWIDKEEWNKRLLTYIQSIQNDTFKFEFTKFLLDDLLHIDFRAIDENSHLKELKNLLPKIKSHLVKFLQCDEEEICFGNYNPKQREFCNYKYITGNADLTNVIIADELTWVLGNVIARDSKIENLGKLLFIGQDAEFDECENIDLSNLIIIGESAWFEGSANINLCNLKIIGRDACFSDSININLQNLEQIEGTADFYETKNINLSSLKKE